MSKASEAVATPLCPDARNGHDESLAFYQSRLHVVTRQPKIAERFRRSPTKPVRFALSALAAIGLVFAVYTWILRPYGTPTGSMEPTLVKGERVLVNRLATYFGNPDIGDIVVFHPPTGADRDECGVRHSPRQACPEPVPEESDTTFIKRVIASPGDRLSLENGQPIVNGEKADESFRSPCPVKERCDFPGEITIPPEHYFVMGDNRANSDDSRFWGPIHEDWIVGEVFATYWPPDQVGAP